MEALALKAHTALSPVRIGIERSPVFSFSNLTPAFPPLSTRGYIQRKNEQPSSSGGKVLFDPGGGPPGGFDQPDPRASVLGFAAFGADTFFIISAQARFVRELKKWIPSRIGAMRLLLILFALRIEENIFCFQFPKQECRRPSGILFPAFAADQGPGVRIVKGIVHLLNKNRKYGLGGRKGRRMDFQQLAQGVADASRDVRPNGGSL